MTELNLSPRLLCAAELVRQDAFVADVGTDHAYLPIYLCLAGRIRGGVASDINRGPIERARRNIVKYGLCATLSTCHTPGLEGIEKFSPTDILILGMGGELIASILADAPWIRNKDISLCLQPMTHAEALRKYLFENGFEVTDERIVREGEKLYQIILASYTKKEIEPYSEEELLLGRLNIKNASPLLSSLASEHLRKIRVRIEGLGRAGRDTGELLKLAEALQKYV